MTPARTLAIAASLALALACTTQPPVDPRLGRVMPDVGLVIGAGTVAGQEWLVGVTAREGRICFTPIIGGRRDATSCTGLDGPVRNDVAMGFSGGQPIVLSGTTASGTAFVELVGIGASWRVVPVSLAPIGMPGGAYAFVVAPGVTFVGVRFIDAAGGVVETVEVHLPQVVP